MENNSKKMEKFFNDIENLAHIAGFNVVTKPVIEFSKNTQIKNLWIDGIGEHRVTLPKIKFTIKFESK